MPIHDQGYRHYAGRRRPPGTAWWVIARQQIRTVLSQKRYLILLLMAWVPFVGRVVQIYLAANFQQASFLATSAQLFRGFLEQQGLFVFLLIVGSSGAIADDRRANALQVYLSKPLTRVEYIAGKLFAPLAFVLGVTLLPALLLLVVHVAFSGSLTFVVQNLYLLPAIVLYSVALALVGTFTMVALSSLSKSRRFTALTFTGLFFFTTAMYTALSRITGSRLWALVSPRDLLSVIGDAAFRVPGQRALPLWTALLGVTVIVALSILVLERRIRGVEVVK
ncbi:MAG TPA: ABC transporter permease subunit [Vicinamibacterales bacterium]|jgi:ABC-2 type transport system permease protein|nr:ABC transporter permease subunit [Vicinamibacterales bacterium]